jgi:hypothetical protein
MEGRLYLVRIFMQIDFFETLIFWQYDHIQHIQYRFEHNERSYELS